MESPVTPASEVIQTTDSTPDYEDESNVDTYIETPEDVKRKTKFDARRNAMKTWGEIWRRKWDKNYRYFRGFNRRPLTDAEALWRSNIDLPMSFARIMGYISRLNDKLPEPVVQALTEAGTDKAKKQRMALEYLLRVTNASREFAKAKMQGVKYGTGMILACYDDTTKLVKDIIDVVDGKPMTQVREVPFYDEPVRIKYVSIYDVWIDPNATGMDDMEDCFIRFLAPTKEVRRAFWTFGNGLGKYVKSAMGDMTDTRENRARMDRQFAEDGTLRSDQIRDANGSLLRSAYQGQAESSRNTSKMTELILYYNQKEDVYQVWCGNLCLLDIPNPYQHKRLPLHMWRNIMDEDSFYGLGEADLLEPYQKVANEIRNDRLDQVKLNIFRMYLIEPQAGLKQKDFIFGPAQFIPVKNANGVKELSPGPVNRDAYEEEDRIEKSADIVSGMADINNAAEQTQSDTATGINVRVQSMEERLNDKNRNFEEEMFIPSLKTLLALAAQYWDDTKIITITGDTGISTEVVNKDDLTEQMDVSCKAGTGLPPNKLAIRDQWMTLFNILGANPNVVNDELVKHLMEVFEVPDWQSLLVSYRQLEQIRHAQKENEGMAVGQPAVVNEVYATDHNLHIAEHTKAMQSPQFSTLQPGIQLLMAQHLQEHQDSLPPSLSTDPNGASQSSNVQPPKVNVAFKGELLPPGVQADLLQEQIPHGTQPPASSGGSAPIDPASSAVPSPVNTTPNAPVVQPGPDALGVPQ